MQFRPALSAMIVAMFTLPGWGAPGHTTIGAGSVATALNGLGMQVQPEQISMLSEVVASSSAPRLKVRSVEKWSNHRMLVRLECESPKECLPFFVSLRLGQADETHFADAASGRPPLSDSLQKPSPRSFAIRAGSRATLLLEGDHVHITIPVLCLENGVAGQKVRVAGNDRRQFYSAEVVDGRLLKGRL